jgi:hypothetical protein
MVRGTVCGFIQHCSSLRLVTLISSAIFVLQGPGKVRGFLYGDRSEQLKVGEKARPNDVQTLVNHIAKEHRTKDTCLRVLKYIFMYFICHVIFFPV